MCRDTSSLGAGAVALLGSFSSFRQQVLQGHLGSIALQTGEKTVISEGFSLYHSVFLIVLNATNWRRKWQPTPIFLSGEFHGQRSLVGSSPWGPKESDMTE